MHSHGGSPYGHPAEPFARLRPGGLRHRRHRVCDNLTEDEGRSEQRNAEGSGERERGDIIKLYLKRFRVDTMFNISALRGATSSSAISLKN